MTTHGQICDHSCYLTLAVYSVHHALCLSGLPWMAWAFCCTWLGLLARMHWQVLASITYIHTDTDLLDCLLD